MNLAPLKKNNLDMSDAETRDALGPAAPRFYYGWVIVVACNLVACITWGVAIFNQGVFIAYFVSTRGWSAAELGIGAVLFHIASGLAGMVVGPAVDRLGPRPVLAVGAVLIALALLGFGYVSEPWHTWIVFTVLGLGYCCIHTITLGKIVARWFVRHRGRAMAASTFGAGVGGALLVPLNAYLIETIGLDAGIWALIAVTLVIILPLALWVIKDGPEAVGQLPDGDLITSSIEAGPDTTADERIWTVAEAMRTVAFWGMSICFSLAMLAQSAFLFYQVPFLQTSLGLTGAAAIVSMSTVAAMIGRVVFIAIGGRLSPKAWTVVMFALQALSFVVLAVAETELMLALGSILFGFTMSVVVVLQPLVTADCFGRASFGRIYGPVYLMIRIGMAAGPALTGLLLAATGNYSAAWLLLAASLLAGVLFVPWAIRKPAPVHL